MPTIYIEASEAENTNDLGYTPLTEASLSVRQLLQNRAGTNDTTSLLKNISGLSLVKTGGVSNLPVMNGFSDDRIRILIDGMALRSACPNHMSPALSYIDPSHVGSATVIAGITPVSMGGDSVAGTILVDSPAPLFRTSRQLVFSVLREVRGVRSILRLPAHFSNHA